jgi:ribosome-binding protein aMBF1 (putative translation factor)
MSDFQKYKARRIKKNPEFWKDYQERFESFKIGVLLKEARRNAGLTQAQIAKKLNTTRSVISRMENHSKDIRLSTLERFASALGKKIHIVLE